MQQTNVVLGTKSWRRLGSVLIALATCAVLTSIVASNAWAAGTYKTLHDFKRGVYGGAPAAGLVLDSVGNLSGTTYFGGHQDAGTAFELSPNGQGGWKEKLLHSFGGTDGALPAAQLALDSSGNLYGTTKQGGASNAGTVFRLTPNKDGSWSESVLHDFTGGNDGGVPLGGVNFDTAGNLYGTASQGGLTACMCGVVFELTPKGDGSWNERVLFSFSSHDGANPGAGVAFDSTGNLYGTTTRGGLGTSNCGVVFELTPNGGGSWNESVLFSFSSHDGCIPLAGVVFDAMANLYGTTVHGGPGGSDGTVFELTPNKDGSWTEKVIHSFNCGDGGCEPSACLAFDSGGNLYGTAPLGGAYRRGTVFKLEPDRKGGWTETVLHAFRDKPGAAPVAGVIFDGLGNRYGTTAGDGMTTFGSVFEISRRN